MKLHLRGTRSYTEALTRLTDRGDEDLDRVTPAVSEILHAVRLRGDEALKEYSLRYDGAVPSPFAYGPDEMARALSRLDPSLAEVLRLSATRIRAYHERQVESGLRYTDEDGVSLGWRVRALSRVGVYAPGGKARYPSSVLMSAIPAAVAGVREVLLATPRPTEEILAAAAIAGVSRVFDMGGAQAIGALAYGTGSVARVDKIVGPGNIYVACAKKLVYGRVAIDGIAGPSEILVVADEGADPEAVAADLLSQAEHDEAAYPLLVATTEAVAMRALDALRHQIASLPRRAIAEASVMANGHAFVVGDLEEAARVVTALASEHLALLVRDPEALLSSVGAAGAAFLGDWTPEAAGDYLAGPSHVLPTGGAVRFSSPLGVYDFMVRTSVIRYDRASLERHGKAITDFARAEGLEAHARAVEVRLRGRS